MKLALSPDHPTQTPYEVRFEWAEPGLRSIAQGVGVIVVVDAISFTTTVGRALEAGLEVVPAAAPADGGDADAVRMLADRHAAAVAAPRGGPGITPSPSSVTAENIAGIAPARCVVIASSNGSGLCVRAASYGVPVVAASLRNRTAVAEWIIHHQERVGERVRVAVVAAGERRSDGSVRAAVEDELTAGAVVDALAAVGIDHSSPEAAVAAAAFTGLRRGLRHLIIGCVTGRQMAEIDARADAELASRIDESDVVPVLTDGIFTAA